MIQNLNFEWYDVLCRFGYIMIKDIEMSESSSSKAEIRGIMHNSLFFIS